MSQSLAPPIAMPPEASPLLRLGRTQNEPLLRFSIERLVRSDFHASPSLVLIIYQSHHNFKRFYCSSFAHVHVSHACGNNALYIYVLSKLFLMLRFNIFLLNATLAWYLPSELTVPPKVSEVVCLFDNRIPFKHYSRSYVILRTTV